MSVVRARRERCRSGLVHGVLLTFACLLLLGCGRASAYPFTTPEGWRFDDGRVTDSWTEPDGLGFIGYRSEAFAGSLAAFTTSVAEAHLELAGVPVEPTTLSIGPASVIRPPGPEAVEVVLWVDGEAGHTLAFSNVDRVTIVEVLASLDPTGG